MLLIGATVTTAGGGIGLLFMNCWYLFIDDDGGGELTGNGIGTAGVAVGLVLPLSLGGGGNRVVTAPTPLLMLVLVVLALTDFTAGAGTVAAALVPLKSGCHSSSSLLSSLLLLLFLFFGSCRLPSEDRSGAGAGAPPLLLLLMADCSETAGRNGLVFLKSSPSSSLLFSSSIELNGTVDLCSGT